MQITICGGGNAAHTLAGILAARPGLTIHVFLPFGDEAQRWQDGLARRGGITVHTPTGQIDGRPHRVSANPTEVVPGSSLVLLALPAFAHEATLHQIGPFLEPEAWVGAIPARGGFDLEAQAIFGPRPARLFGLQTLPWACRIREFGEEVAVLGTKAEIDLAAWPAAEAAGIAALLSDLLGLAIRPIESFLALTVANTGQLIHPGIMYGLFHDWDGQPLAEAPLFYQGVDAFTAATLQRMSDEVQQVCRALAAVLPGLGLEAVPPLGTWLHRSYRDGIADPSTLQSSFVTNRGYAGLKAPVRAVPGGLAPDFHSRYLTEDIPFGMLVTVGLAELAGVQTPLLGQVIDWAQVRMGMDFRSQNRLSGPDLVRSRVPQKFGFSSLPGLVAHYGIM